MHCFAFRITHLLEDKQQQFDLEKVAIEVDIEYLGHMVAECLNTYFVDS